MNQDLLTGWAFGLITLVLGFGGRSHHRGPRLVTIQPPFVVAYLISMMLAIVFLVSGLSRLVMTWVVAACG